MHNISIMFSQQINDPNCSLLGGYLLGEYSMLRIVGIVFLCLIVYKAVDTIIIEQIIIAIKKHIKNIKNKKKIV